MIGADPDDDPPERAPRGRRGAAFVHDRTSSTSRRPSSSPLQARGSVPGTLRYSPFPGEGSSPAATPLLDQGVGHTRQHARHDKESLHSVSSACSRRQCVSGGLERAQDPWPSDITPPSSCQLFASHRAQRWKTTSRPAIRMRIVISAPFAQRVQACIGGLLPFAVWCYRPRPRKPEEA